MAAHLNRETAGVPFLQQEEWHAWWGAGHGLPEEVAVQARLEHAHLRRIPNQEIQTRRETIDAVNEQREMNACGPRDRIPWHGPAQDGTPAVRHDPCHHREKPRC